jgi:hypothetical protein
MVTKKLKILRWMNATALKTLDKLAWKNENKQLMSQAFENIRPQYH